ncbi:ectoine/hydroxyectoine ABC transporter permease subunit EhuC [Bacillaceae bacterium]
MTIETYMELLPALLRGAGVTVRVLVLSAALAFFIAFLAGFGRLSKHKTVRRLTGLYVELFRGTSLLVQMFWFYFAFPFFGVKLSAMAAGVISLGLNYGAYASEIVRSSILAVPTGQTEAAIALNMTPRQRMQRVILPQAFRLMLPGFGNISVEMLKGTALVSLVTLGDLTYQAMTLRNANIGWTTEIFTLLLLMYFLLALPLILLSRWLERRVSIGR